jgi:hypothetical protein
MAAPSWLPSAWLWNTNTVSPFHYGLIAAALSREQGSLELQIKGFSLTGYMPTRKSVR